MLPDVDKHIGDGLLDLLGRVAREHGVTDRVHGGAVGMDQLLHTAFGFCCQQYQKFAFFHPITPF